MKSKFDILCSLLAIWGIILFMILFSLAGNALSYSDFSSERNNRQAEDPPYLPIEGLSYLSQTSALSSSDSHEDSPFPAPEASSAVLSAGDPLPASMASLTDDFPFAAEPDPSGEVLSAPEPKASDAPIPAALFISGFSFFLTVFLLRRSGQKRKILDQSQR